MPERITRVCCLACLLIGSAALHGEEVQASPTPTWSLHAQATWIDQAHPSFSSPYEGANSLTADSESERTFSGSLFLGLRLLDGLDVYYNPEAIQGHGLSRTLGMAGFPNGEALRAAYPHFHYSASRLYAQYTLGLGGETEKVDDGPNQVAMVRSVDHLTFSFGKVAASDFFDANTYSKDDRSQFMNWSLWESAAWDYPADAAGFTTGAVAEWYSKDWVLHYGVFMEPTVSNGATLDSHPLKAHGQILQFDHPYHWGSNSGTLRPFLFWNEARMGNYEDALKTPGMDLLATRAYRSKAGFGLSWDQTLGDDLGLFARVSWNDGHAESFAFTEIDRSAALGLSLGGSRWGRKEDVLGVAAVVNAIVGDHQAYLAAGGTEGLILGDGALRYGPEEIVEAYYSASLTRSLSISPDFQFASHPGYNRDRGPVAFYALRLHASY